MSVEVRITEDHTDEVISAKDLAVLRALEAIGIKCEGYAKLLCPVDTGRLRNSITHALSGSSPAISSYKNNNTHATTNATQKAGTAGKPVKVKTYTYDGTAPKGKDAVYVGTNVEYAPYIEYGSQRSEAQPFLKPAVQDHAEEYKKIAESYLKGQ